MSLYLGDVRDGLRQFIAAGVRAQACVTSPPYWGLRDYGTAQWAGGDEDCEHVGSESRTVSGGPGKQYTNAGSNRVYSGDCDCGATRIDRQLGLEPTIAEYVANMVAVFRLVREVLADDGVLWLNLGDSYTPVNRGENARPRVETMTGIISGLAEANLKPKDLCGIPWRVAFALQADGWWLRQDIIWAKPNPMPESVTDRCTKAHEYLFLLAKRERYYYDCDAIREAPTVRELADPVEYFARDTIPRSNDMTNFGMMPDGARGMYGEPSCHPAGRNRRSVWTVTTQPYAEAHFATFPVALVEPCIMAGTSQRGHCPACGKGWERVTKDEPCATHGQRNPKPSRDETGMDAGQSWNSARTYSGTVQRTTTGWAPTCTCNLEPVPGVVLDPFMGSGTVAQVAQDLGRQWIGCELNPEYAKLIRRRTAQQGLALA